MSDSDKDSDSDKETKHSLDEHKAALQTFDWESLKKACELEPKCFGMIQQVYAIFKPKKRKISDVLEFSDLKIGSELEILLLDGWIRAKVFDIAMEDTRIFAYVNMDNGRSIKFSNRNMNMIRKVQESPTKKQRFNDLTIGRKVQVLVEDAEIAGYDWKDGEITGKTADEWEVKVGEKTLKLQEHEVQQRLKLI